MICPNCSAGEISPLTHRCELCGFDPQTAVAVEAPHAALTEELARRELASQFQLDALLGHGKTTAVFAARAQGSNRSIAIKVLPRPTGRPGRDDRFSRAVDSIAGLEHPHIVPVFDQGTTEHLYWYSMEHVTAESLRTFLERHGPMDMKGCLRVISQIASALDYAHRRGIVHGALKPENVLIDEDGWVHVCDPLVTRAIEDQPLPRPPAPPQAAEQAESPEAEAAALPPAPAPERLPYAAPEDLWTPSADQYALSILVAECLNGAPIPGLVEGAPGERLRAALPDVPRHVTDAIARALSERPMDRFTGTLDFVHALESPGAAAPAPEVRPSGTASSVVLRNTDWTPPSRRLSPRMTGIILGVAALVWAATWGRPAIVGFVRRLAGGGQPTYATLPSTDIPGAAAPGTPRGGPPPKWKPPADAPGAGATAPASSSGHLFVNSTPWGQLYLDGQLIGNTPRANLSVAPGLHALRVLREGYQPYGVTITVTPGQTVRMTDIALTPVQ